jgi:methanogenic corrinoid protein MtbC1
VHAALTGNLYQATELALQYMAVTKSRATVITDLFSGAHLQAEDAWHIGDATAQDEYRVFQAVESAVAALPRSASSYGVGYQGTILLATVWPEEHDLGLRLVALALREAGFKADLIIGVLPDDLVARAAQSASRVVGLSATVVDARLRLQLAALIEELHKLGKLVIAGGSSFRRLPMLAEQIGVDAVAGDARLAVMMARRLRIAKQHPLDRGGRRIAS